MNAEFQRIAKRYKKTFLSDQCKEIQKNNRVGKTRELFKNTGDTKGTFHAKIGNIKDKNCKDVNRSRRNSENVARIHSVQFSSDAQSCPTLCDPMNRSMPGLPVHHQLSEFTHSRPSSQ